MTNILGDKRFEIFKECGYVHAKEVSYGNYIWWTAEAQEFMDKKIIEENYFLYAKPFGNFSNFSIVMAATIEDAIDLLSKDIDITFKCESEEQIKIILKLLLNHNESTDLEHVAFWKALLQYMDDHREYYKGAFSEAIENELDQKRVAMERLLLNIFKKEWDKAKQFN